MMKAMFFVLLTIFVFVFVPHVHGIHLDPYEKLLEPLWQRFKHLEQRHYGSRTEHAARKRIFAANVEQILAHNGAGDRFTYTLALNKFADMTDTERAKLNGLRLPMAPRGASNFSIPLLDRVKRSSSQKKSDVKDWRSEDRLSDVKDQGSCGSCYAFAAVGAIEAHLAIAANSDVKTDLSAQHLVDCSRPYGNEGCAGGQMDPCFSFIGDHGLASDRKYPYVGHDETCKRPPISTSLQGFVDIASFDEDSMKLVIANIGPITAAVDASSPAFAFYSEGIYSGDSRCSKMPNHGVLLVGFGTDHRTGLDYWILRNSWGKDWGEDGYMRIARGSNECGVGLLPSFPLI